MGKYTGFFLLVVSVIMMLDASMAFILGKRYMYWALEYMPAWYRNFILKVYKYPRYILWFLMFAEMLVGIWLFLLAYESL